MNATTRNNTIDTMNKLAITTEELQSVLSCGRKTAVGIGRDACACIQYGRRILWNVSRIQIHLNAVSI